MVVRDVRLTDLKQCRDLIEGEVNQIVAEIATMNENVAKTDFIGEKADEFALNMNTNVNAFADQQRTNLLTILQNVTDNMNVIVVKLGGTAWASPEPVSFEIAAQALAQQGDNYLIDDSSMVSLGEEITGHLGKIAALYEGMVPTAFGPSLWLGPERDETQTALAGQISSVIVPDVEATRVGLTSQLEAQVQLMNS